MIELDLVLKTKEVVAGGSLPLSVVVRNAAPNSIVTVHSTETQSPFEYEFVSARDGSVRKLSASLFFQEFFRDPPPPSMPEMQPLVPKQELRYEEDVAAYAATPLEPAEYTVTVRYAHQGTVHSAKPQTISIVAPRVEAFAAAPNAGHVRLGSTFAHRAGDGRVSVYHRESRTNRPDLGVAYERHIAPSGQRIDGVALATEIDETVDWRWVAWLESGSFRASAGWGKDLVHATGASALGVASPRLIETGWQFAKGDGLFLALGMLDGRARLKLLSIPVGKEPRHQTLDLAAAMPDAVVAGCAEQGGQIRIHVVWAERSNGFTRLYARAYTPGAPNAGAPALLAERSEPLAALGMQAVVHGGAPAVNALFGPAGNERRMIYVRVAAAKDAKPAEWRFTAPAGEIGGWAIDPGATENRYVLAKSGDRLVVMDAAPDASWSVLAEKAPEAAHLSLSDAIETWAAWTEPGKAIQYRKVR